MPDEVAFDSTDLLFHFTEANTAVNHILPSGKLRLSPLGGTGDPIEYRHFDIIISGSNLPELAQLNPSWNHAVAEIDRVRREESFVGCFCQRHEKFEDRPPYRRSRMWSQYADDHRGVCLVFDQSELLAAADSSNSGDKTVAALIDYQAEPFVEDFPPIDPNALERDGATVYAYRYLREYGREVYLFKDTDYRDEAEFRLVMTAKETDHIYLDIRDALVGVILGDRFPQNHIQDVRELAAVYDSDVVQLGWTSRSSWLLNMDEGRP